MWTDAPGRTAVRRAAALALLAAGLLAATPVAALELVLRNDTDEQLSCSVQGRFRASAGVDFTVMLIDDWWPMFAGQHLHSLPWMLWQIGGVGVSSVGASFVEAVLQCRGGAGAQRYTVRATLDRNDPFWDTWNGHAQHCPPDPGSRLTLHIMRLAPDGVDDGFALRGSCWLGNGRGKFRVIEPLPVIPGP